MKNSNKKHIKHINKNKTEKLKKHSKTENKSQKDSKIETKFKENKVQKQKTIVWQNDLDNGFQNGFKNGRNHLNPFESWVALKKAV